MIDEHSSKEDLYNELIRLRRENQGWKDSNNLYDNIDEQFKLLSDNVTLKNSMIAISPAERDALMESLRKSEELLNLASLTAGVGVWSWTPQNRHLIVSANWRSLLGIPEEDEVTIEAWRDALHPDDREHVFNELNSAIEEHHEFNIEYRVVSPEGTVRWIADRGRILFNEKGRPVSMFGVNVDITEHKRSEKSTQLSRLYNVLSKINEAIVRIREPQKLFEETCRVAVEDGQFILAWIGLADPDTKLIEVVAKQGDDEGYLDNVRISIDKDTPEGQGPTGNALREGMVFVNNDTENNPEMRPWRDEQLKRSYRSSASIPFIIENQTVGVITLYANRTNYFDEEEIQLLQSLADDVSFAIESADILRQRKEIEKEAEELLAAERKRFNDILELLPAYLILLTPDYHVPFANRFFRERFGESNGRRCFEYLFELSKPCENCETYEVLQTMSPKEWEWTGPDGRNYHIYDFPFIDADGATLIMEMGIDITELKVKEELLRAEIEEHHITVNEKNDILESISDYFFALDNNLRYIYVNKAMERLMGSRESIIGRTLTEVNPNYDRTAFTIYQQVLWEKKPLYFESFSNQFQVWTENSVYPSKEGVSVYSRDISERKAAEETVRLSEQKTATILESISDAFYALDREWRFTYVNAEMMRQFKIQDASEVIGQVIWDAFPNYSDLTYELFRNAVEEQTSVFYEMYSQITGRWHYAHAYPSPDGLSVYFLDITEIKETQDKLQKSQQDISDILGSISDPFIVLDNQWRITYFNQGTVNILGKTPAELLGRDYRNVIPQLVGSEVYKKYCQVMSEKVPVNFEDHGVYHDLWYVFNVYPCKDGIAIYARDITEKKQMEQQIVDALEINTAILESSPLAIYAYNLSGQCVLTNDAGAVIGGGTKEQILEVNFNNHEHWKETGLLESVNRVLSTGTPEHREVFMRNVFAKQGWFDFRFSRFFSGGEPHLLLVYDDVTERKQAEETIRQSEEKYSKAFHGMPIMMTLASIEEGRFIDANAALYAESGYSPEEIIGHTSLELNLFPNSVRADFIAILLQEGRLENFEVDMRNKAGEIRNCLCWSQLIQVHNQLCNMTATIDITEQRRVQKELEQVERFNFISEMAVSMSSRFEEKLQIATEETRQELDRFKEAFSRAVGLEKIVINSESMKKIFLLAAKMHEDRKLPVLIEGETGTGKEVIAKYIHYGNGNVTTPFIALNCAAIAPSIFESELFGYEAGAFTGGLSKGQKGKLDMAKGGTLFLDEITELPIDLQAKLLRVLQENEYFRVGGQKVLHTDVRIICATNQKIEDMVAEGRFRQDLYYRLNVGRIHLPPLRERVEDILPLAYSFLTAFAEEKGSQFRAINQEAGKILEAYEWPGNVREIRNAMQRVVLLWDGWEVKPQYLDFLHNSNRTGQLQNDKSPAALDLSDIVLPADKLPIEDVYNAIVSKALAFNNGNKTKTAQYLQISRNSLMYRLKQIEQDAK